MFFSKAKERKYNLSSRIERNFREALIFRHSGINYNDLFIKLLDKYEKIYSILLSKWTIRLRRLKMNVKQFFIKLRVKMKRMCSNFRIFFLNYSFKRTFFLSKGVYLSTNENIV